MTTSRSKGGKRRSGLFVLAAIAAAALLLFLFVPRFSAWMNLSEAEGPTDTETNAAAPVEPSREPTGLRALPKEAQLARASQAAFGDPTGARIGVDTGSDYGEGGSFEEMVAYTPRDIVWASFGPILLSEGSVVDAAHVSAGKIAAHYLREDGESFALVKAYPKAVVTGSFGEVGRWNVSDAFLPQPVVYAEGGGTWQGYSCAWGSLTALTPDGPVEVARFPLAYSNEGAVGPEEARSTTGKIGNVVKGQSFNVVYSGAQAITEHYVLKDGKFVLQGGESKVESC